MPIETVIPHWKPTNIYIAIVEIAIVTCFIAIIQFEIKDLVDILEENKKINKATKHIISFSCQFIVYLIVSILILHLWGYQMGLVKNVPNISIFSSIVISFAIISILIIILILIHYLIQKEKKEKFYLQK